MIGSLGQFIDLHTSQNKEHPTSSIKQALPQQPTSANKRRGKSAFDSYIPDDKRELLIRYQKNNLYHINRRKYNSLAKQVATKQKVRKPIVEHHSFFVKPEVARDYIAKDELKRKHNLLRAIMRLKQTEEEPNRESDYEQSFQRLYSGFTNVHPIPVLTKQQQQSLEEAVLPPALPTPARHQRQKSGLDHNKRLEYEHCLRWAKIHQKKGDFFAEQLGKLPKKSDAENPIVNRSLMEEISHKVNLSWLD